jgi:phosphatidylethanolamine/phosphatidyl-N-methylethanolamine N-methyltransferase
MGDTLLFFGQMFRGWRPIGAIAPSGSVLARTIAEGIDEAGDGQVIVELGPGTGVITRELVRRFPQARIVAVEVNEAFAAHLAEEFPSVTVVTGCASELDRHLADLGLDSKDVAGVASGLPLLALPGDFPQRILASIAGILPPGRPYVQFTYSRLAWKRFVVEGFQPHSSRRVWRNVPPATVLKFTRDQVPVAVAASASGSA